MRVARGHSPEFRLVYLRLRFADDNAIGSSVNGTSGVVRAEVCAVQ